MFKQVIIRGLGIMLLAGVVMLGCSGDEKSGELSTVRRVVDTVATKVAENFVEASFASAKAGENFVTIPEGGKKNASGVNEIVMHDSLLFAATHDGLLVYDFADNSSGYAGAGKKFSALAIYEGNLYAGGDGLYIVNDKMLQPVEADIKGQVTSLFSESARLLIGTDRGLVSKSPLGMDNLLDDVSVTSIASDGIGLWIGTDGQGLFRWDGDEFRKRYLIRDTSIFDNVYALDFNHDHLFVGASTGFFVFDGGRWEQWTEEMGLPSNTVKSIDASKWMVYIGTDGGVVSYFDNNLYPVKKFESTPADVVRAAGGKIVAAGSDGSILLKQGVAIKTLVEPAEKAEPEVFTQVEDEL